MKTAQVKSCMTWHEHLYGEDWRPVGENSPGLIPQLSQTLGILKKLSKYTSKKKLKMLTEGIFYSKLSYCSYNTWGLDNYVEGNQRFTSFTKEDNQRLQVIQNQVCRLLLDRSEQHRVRYFRQNISTKE